MLESRASVKRKDVVRRSKAEEDCLTLFTSRGYCQSIHLNRLTMQGLKFSKPFLTIMLCLFIKRMKAERRTRGGHRFSYSRQILTFLQVCLDLSIFVLYLYVLT